MRPGLVELSEKRVGEPEPRQLGQGRRRPLKIGEPALGDFGRLLKNLGDRPRACENGSPLLADPTGVEQLAKLLEGGIGSAQELARRRRVYCPRGTGTPARRGVRSRRSLID